MGLDRNFVFPPLYAILDAESCARRGLDLLEVARTWRAAGISLVQYRDKRSDDVEFARNSRAIRGIFEGFSLILNDRAHLVAATGADGVHVGQGDASVAAVRALLGPHAVIGVSTHNVAEIAEADGLAVSYVAVGPVFATSTKLDAEPVVGLDGVRAARGLTRKPLVAIGGIALDTLPSVLGAGADAVALISGLLDGDVREFVQSVREVR